MLSIYPIQLLGSRARSAREAYDLTAVYYPTVGSSAARSAREAYDLTAVYYPTV
jgi:hypothetical protein